MFVQDRKSVTSKRGILGPGKDVKASDFVGGEDSIKKLVEKGVLGKDAPDLRTKAELVEAREAKKNSNKKKGSEKKEISNGAIKK